ncbi:sigma-70 family RNA polymerase sigma factor [Aureisphaera galaxeae]|uniref:RNA polymerase sigma factor n=1 Tax=Aureisphaera galaxeae TaxID=1538023 RepID=UPI002350D0D7|nr:sigma-70 family RNA polymerase sigma factor [Aureisphaera galaxeae]MDC8003912.1 sigma-70 family RNA polymerase sigma factor [Aureisphaera galaxeae]
MPLKRTILECKELLYRLALQMLHNQHDAEDAVSDFYIKVLEKKDQFSKYDNLKGALIRSMKNHCINLLKSKKRLLPLEEIPSEITDATNPIFSDDKRLALVQTIINELSEKQRIMIHLRMIEGYSMKQIAEIMEEKVNTVEVNISRARKRIRTEYENRRSK